MHPILASAFLLTAASLSAQTVVGLTANVQAVTSQDFGANCQVNSCNINALLGGNTGNPFDGGTAVDMRRGGIWITNGIRVAMVSFNGCTVMCAPFAPAVGGTITGLAMHEASGNIYALTTAGSLYTIAAGCPWQVITRCPINQIMPAGWVAGGLAIDDRNNLILIAAADPATAGTATVFVTTIAAPCNPICRIPASRCGGNVLGTPTGAAFDPCASTLYVTDGRQTTQILCNFANCTSQFQRCCLNTTADPYIGLCLLPTPSTSTGRGCTTANCPPCTPTHTVSTVPYPGNPAFNLALSGAPANGLGYLLIGQGPCQAVGVPFSCDAIRTIPLLTALGPLPLGGGGGCTGSANVSLAIPNNYNLCGLQLASQWFMLCNTAATGSGLSNCVTWTISGS